MHVEKPSSTSAAVTAFCAHKLTAPSLDGHLWIDGNGKITAGNGTLDNPKPNAFSLVEISDCPGSTPTCQKACYVHGLKKHAPETHALYQHNSQTIRSILACRDLFTKIDWALCMASYIEANCQGGFRWHVSGDIFNRDYADFIYCVVANSKTVRHWIYTRSFDFVADLVPLSTERGGNLAINLSCDRDNYDAAFQTAIKHNLRLCYLTHDGKVPLLQDGDVIFPDYALRGGTPEGQAWFAGLGATYKSYVCPVDYHGKAENRRCGPCSRCLK